MSEMKKTSENVNKREFFKKLFCTWKYKPKATSYATFKIFHQYLLQKLNFIRIHVKFDPKWFPSPGACQGHFFQPLLWPMVGTMIGTYIFGKIAEFLSFAFSKLSWSVAQFLLMHPPTIVPLDIKCRLKSWQHFISSRQFLIVGIPTRNLGSLERKLFLFHILRPFS